MTTFNSTNFIKALKESYDMIPYFENNQAAKVIVADAIKRYKFNPEEVLSFICSEMGNPSIELGKDDWKTIFKKAVKNGGLEGKCLEVCADVEGKKVSREDIFSTVMKRCGKNAGYVKSELYLDMLGWQKAVETLVKTEVVEETVESKEEEKKETAKVETKVEETEKTKKTATKSTKLDPRCKSITLINKKTGEVKTWLSYRGCERELGVKPGTISQVASEHMTHAKDWVLYKEEENTPVESKKQKRSKSKGVIQMKKDENGNFVVVSTYSSISEAAKATGCSYSGIYKAISGTYKHSGDYRWKVAEAAA